MDDNVAHYKYVPHHQRGKWEEAGWEFHRDLGPPHAAYSSLYVWPHEGEPVIPENTDVNIVKVTHASDCDE